VKEVLENAIMCDNYKSNMMHNMHKLTNHCNQEQEKMKKQSDGGFKKCSDAQQLQIKHNACTNQPTPTIENNNKQQCKKSPQTK
jgi:hypothetical protein